MHLFHTLSASSSLRNASLVSSKCLGNQRITEFQAGGISSAHAKGLICLVKYAYLVKKRFIAKSIERG